MPEEMRTASVIHFMGIAIKVARHRSLLIVAPSPWCGVTIR